MKTFEEYQRAAARTGGSDLLPENHDKGLNCSAMGLAGEAGEVCDLVKKWQHHRAPRDFEKLKREAGDVLWYLAHLCNVMGWSLDEIAALNVEKLRARYPEGFTTVDSVARRDEVMTPRENALEVLARASKGRVSPFAGARDQVALAAALADVGLVGAELEAFGAALAGDGASRLWPRSEPAKGRAALTCGFFLGRAGDARMLADGVTRWREAQQRERDEVAALARIAAPVVKAGPSPDEMVARASEIFRKAREERLQGVSRAG